MRQAATKQQLEEAELEQQKVSDASRWTLNTETEQSSSRASSPATPTQITVGKSKVRILKGIGFQIIDSTVAEEGSPSSTGRKSWGRFNTVCIPSYTLQLRP